MNQQFVYLLEVLSTVSSVRLLDPFRQRSYLSRLLSVRLSDDNRSAVSFCRHGQYYLGPTVQLQMGPGGVSDHALADRSEAFEFICQLSGTISGTPWQFDMQPMTLRGFVDR